MSEPMPWPKREDYMVNMTWRDFAGYEVKEPSFLDEASFDRAMKEAYAARLRVAIYALEEISASANGSTAVQGNQNYDPWKIINWCIDGADRALETIGEIPE